MQELRCQLRCPPAPLLSWLPSVISPHTQFVPTTAYHRWQVAAWERLQRELERWRAEAYTPARVRLANKDRLSVEFEVDKQAIG